MGYFTNILQKNINGNSAEQVAQSVEPSMNLGLSGLIPRSSRLHVKVSLQ